MLKLFIFISTLTLINADEYGARLGKSLANSGISGPISAILNSGRFNGQSNRFLTGLSGKAYILGGAGIVGHSDPISAAIETKRNVEIVPVYAPQEPIVPQVIEVSANELPVSILFKTQSSRVFVEQLHTPGAPAEVQESRSQDEPHLLRHEVIRPVIQELHEIIQPFRRVIQTIQPVIEEIHSVVAKGEPRLNVAPVSAVSSAIPSPVVPSIGGVIGAQRLVGSLTDQNLYGSLSDQKYFVPIGGQELGGALSGLVLDNGLNGGTNFILMSALPESLGLSADKYVGSSAALNSVETKAATAPTLGVAPPRLVLGGAQYMVAAKNLGFESLSKLLEKSKLKAAAKAA